MSSSKNVIDWRQRTKERLANGLGGKCNRCGYSRCLDCLHFHHIDESKKKFTISNATTSPKAWDIIVEEVKKCVLLCSICHGELHAGLWKLSEIELAPFCDLYLRLPPQKDAPTGKCPVCDEPVYFGNKCCSRACGAKRAWKANWPEKVVLVEMLKISSNCEIARQMGVTEAAVRKKLKKLGLSRSFI